MFASTVVSGFISCMYVIMDHLYTIEITMYQCSGNNHLESKWVYFITSFMASGQVLIISQSSKASKMHVVAACHHQKSWTPGPMHCLLATCAIGMQRVETVDGNCDFSVDRIVTDRLAQLSTPAPIWKNLHVHWFKKCGMLQHLGALIWALQ